MSKKASRGTNFWWMAFIFFLVVVVSGVIIYSNSASEITKFEQEKSVKVEKRSLSPAVRAVVDKNISLIEEELATNDLLIRHLIEANAKSRKLSLEEVENLDQKWGADEANTDLLNSLLSNEVAGVLNTSRRSFSEIFVTDVVGFNIGQTSKTTDYYQADKEWWIEAYNNGLGKAHYSSIEYDKSAKVEAVSLYVPVYNPGNEKKVIGVIKAVISINDIQKEL